MKFVITWQDISGLHKFRRQIEDLNQKFPKVLPRIVNQVGDRAKTRVSRALVKQTGLNRDVIKRAVNNSARAFSGKLTYDLRSRGGNIRLKYFSPVETPQGVTAKPFGRQTMFAESFMRGGRFPNRVDVPKFDGHVYRRLNRSGSHITQTRSGVFIPKEMIEGMARQAFLTEAETTLPIRVDRVIRKLLS